MEKTYNILSIDFDYFQNVSAKTIIQSYIDGHDYPSKLSASIWVTHYARKSTKEDLLGVTLNKKAFNEVSLMIKNNSRCNAMAVNSHSYMMLFLRDTLPFKDVKVNIYNIDMHHDMFTSAEEQLDCGNWASHAKAVYPNSKMLWVKHKISEDLYPSDEPDEVYDSLDKLKEIDFDGIFLCRSNCYLPPHLDDSFDKMLSTLKRYHDLEYVENDIKSPRRYKEEAEQLEQIFNEMEKGLLQDKDLKR